MCNAFKDGINKDEGLSDSSSCVGECWPFNIRSYGSLHCIPLLVCNHEAHSLP